MTTLHQLTATTPGLPCRTTDPELWFSRSSTDRELAIALCRQCPLQQPCAQYALDNRGLSGVWGGTTAADRRLFWTGERCRLDEQGRLRLLCGSEKAYRAHFSYREQPGPTCVDGDCVAAHEAQVAADRRARLDAEHAKGGTPTGYHLHWRLGEKACDDCRSALGRQSKARRDRERAASQRAHSEWTAPGSAEDPPGAPAAVQPLALAG